jgi:hypothetical protein
MTTFTDRHGDKITLYRNELAATLLEIEEERRTLKRFKPKGLTTRFSWLLQITLRR